MQRGPVQFSQNEIKQFDEIMSINSYSGKRVAIDKLSATEKARYQLYFSKQRPQYNEAHPESTQTPRMNNFLLSMERYKKTSETAASSTAIAKEISIDSSQSSSDSYDSSDSEDNPKLVIKNLRNSI